VDTNTLYRTGRPSSKNNLSVSFIFSTLIAIICELCGSLNTSAFFVALACAVSWIYTLSLLLGFNLTGPFVIMIYKMLSSDVARFIIIYLIILVGYSVAIFALEDPVPWGTEFRDIFYGRVYPLMMTMLGGVDFDNFPLNTMAIFPDPPVGTPVRSNYIPFSTLLYLSYVILITILLLNLLIAMMGNTFGAVKERSREEWHMAYAQIIFSLESELPESFWNDKDAFVPYWVTIDNKRFLQVDEDNSEAYIAGIAQRVKESEEEVVKLFDVNGDGVVSREEMQLGLEKLAQSGLELGRQDSREQKHVVSADQLGPQSGLANRLDPNLSKD